MAEIVVVGAGIAGLGSALMLGRAGHQVTVLERDSTPFPESPEAAFESWDRKGAPQVRHSHAFLARLRNLLRDRLPDVLESLLAEGAEELPITNLLREGIDDTSPREGDDDLSMLACRRLTFEWVLHRAAQEQEGVTLRDGSTVTGLRLDQSREIPRAVGITLDDGTEISADLIVDASGRRSRLATWMEEAGIDKPEVESEPCGIFYCSRFYRLLPGATPPAQETTIGADLGYLKYAIFHGDSKIFSITFAAAPEDKPMRRLLHEAPFTAAAEALPATRPWIAPDVAEPISPVYPMDGLRNTRRFFIREGRPLLLGVLPIGDAAIHTNPLYGRGCTFGLVHAAMLVDRLAEHGDDLEALALGLDEDSEREIVPWYLMTQTQDREAAQIAEKLRNPQPAEDSQEEETKTDVVDPKAYMRDVMKRGLLPALRLDATVLRAFFRGFNLLDPPGDLMKRADVLQRVLKVYQDREQRTEPDAGPNRGSLIVVLEAA